MEAYTADECDRNYTNKNNTVYRKVTIEEQKGLSAELRNALEMMTVVESHLLILWLGCESICTSILKRSSRGSTYSKLLIMLCYVIEKRKERFSLSLSPHAIE